MTCDERKPSTGTIRPDDKYWLVEGQWLFKFCAHPDRPTSAPRWHRVASRNWRTGAITVVVGWVTEREADDAFDLLYVMQRAM